MHFNEQQEQLIKYLDKNYEVKENRFFRRYDNYQEWGCSITNSLVGILSFEHEFCVMNLKFWSENHGLQDRDWDLAWDTHKLKTQWNLQMVNELEGYGVTNSEERIITMLANELAREIDSEILKQLIPKVHTLDEFINVVKCVGYEATQTFYNPYTHKPQKSFASMNQNDIKNERQINPHWQDWLKNKS